MITVRAPAQGLSFVFEILCREWLGVETCPAAAVAGFPKIQRGLFELPLVCTALSGFLLATVAALPRSVKVSWMAGFGMIFCASLAGSSRWILEGTDPESPAIATLADAHHALSLVARVCIVGIGIGAAATFESPLSRFLSGNVAVCSVPLVLLVGGLVHAQVDEVLGFLPTALLLLFSGSMQLGRSDTVAGLLLGALACIFGGKVLPELGRWHEPFGFTDTDVFHLGLASGLLLITIAVAIETHIATGVAPAAERAAKAKSE
jgi:hypothetical protein